MRSTRHHGAVLAASCALLLAGCGGGGQSDPEELEEWSVSPEPTLSVGGHDDRPEYVLHEVAGATRLSDGRVVIADRSSSELRFYRPDGSFEQAVGGDGDGPGEMRYVLDLVRLDGDTLLALSARPGLTWFTADGEYVRSQRVDMFTGVLVPCRLGEGNWRPLRDGSLLTILEDNPAPSSCGGTPEGPWRMTGLIGHRPAGSEGIDTVAIMPATERNGNNYRVYGGSLLLAPATDRVYATETRSERIHALTLGGDTINNFPTPYGPVNLTAAAKAEELIRWQRPDGSTVIAGEYEYADVYPRTGRLLVDEGDALWVMAYPVVEEPLNSWRLASNIAPYVEAGGARWTVFDPSGAPMASVRTPEGLFAFEIGADYVLGVSRDDLDVETVSLHEMVR